jgi:hypothetical protein
MKKMDSFQIKNLQIINSNKKNKKNQRLSVTQDNINLKLPNLQNLNSEIIKKKEKKIKIIISPNKNLLNQEKEIKSKKQKQELKDFELLKKPNNNNKYEKTYKSSLINKPSKKINNTNNENLYFSYNNIYNSIDNSIINNEIDKKNNNKTVLNYYINNSIKNSPSLNLLSSNVNSSTSAQNTTLSYIKTYYQKKNPSRNNNKNFAPIRLTQDNLNTFSFSDNKSIIFSNSTNSRKNKVVIDSIDNNNKSVNIRKKMIKIIKKENLEEMIKKKHEKFISELQINDINELKKNEIIKNKSFQCCIFIQKKMNKTIDESCKNLILIKENISKVKSTLIKSNKRIMKKMENSFFKKKRKTELKKNINELYNCFLNYLINNYFEEKVYERMLENYLSNDIEYIKRIVYKRQSIKNLELMRYDKKHEENFYFIQERFIKLDLNLNKCLYKYLFNLQSDNKINKKIGNKVKYKNSKRRFSILNNIKFTSTILHRKYFNRLNDKITLDKRTLYIKNLQLKNKPKIKDIQYHIDRITKNRNLTKEKSVYKTEELKVKLKKELQSIEEILFFLIKENNIQEFKDILEKFQISVESRNKNKDTFLIYATKFGNEKLINFLITKGANVNAQNSDLNTSLHYALINKNFKIADIFLKEGADETLLNKFGLSPWQYA